MPDRMTTETKTSMVTPKTPMHLKVTWRAVMAELVEKTPKSTSILKMLEILDTFLQTM